MLGVTLFGLFLTPESPAVPIAIHINQVVAWSFVLFGISIVLTAAMRANGAVFAPLIILFVASFPVRFGAALAFHDRYASEAIWWSFPLGSVAAVLMTAGYYFLGDWRSRPPLARPAVAA